MNKKILTILLGMGLVVSLCSCGTKETEPVVTQPSTETTIIETTTEETTTESTTEETTEMTTTESRIDKYDIYPVEEIIPDSNDLIIYLSVTPEDESSLTAGPKEYRYVYADVYVPYSGSSKAPKGAFIVSGVRCILSREPIIEHGLYAWLIDDNNGVTEAINNFCASKKISYMDLGEVGAANIQRIYNEFDSSLRYVDWYTMKYHMLDGDEYTEEC